MNVKEQLANWQQLIGSSPVLIDEYEAIKKNLEDQKKPNAEGLALQRVHAKFKNLTRSKAPSFTGVIVAKAEPVDYNEYKWKHAKELFEKDPGLAMSGEYKDDGTLKFKTNDKGEPLDVQERWPSGDSNKNFLKVVDKHSWTRYIDGVAALTQPDTKNPTKADVPTRFILTVKDDLADPNSKNYFNPPEGISIEFRANDKTPKGADILKLNGAVVTNKWSPSKVSMPNVETLIDKYYAENKINAKDIVTAFESKGKVLVIVDGFVVSMNNEPNKRGSRMVQITTMEMEEQEQKMITGWIPAHVKMDFSEESEIRVIGMMDRGFVYEDGKKTDEIGEVNLNVRAIYVLNSVDAPPTVNEFDPAKFQEQMPDAFMS